MYMCVDVHGYHILCTCTYINKHTLRDNIDSTVRVYCIQTHMYVQYVNVIFYISHTHMRTCITHYTYMLKTQSVRRRDMDVRQVIH